MLTDEQRQAVLRALREGCKTVADAARAAGCHRTRVHDAARLDPAFGRQLADARAAARQSPVPADAPLTPYDSEDDLSRDQINAFCRALHKTGSVQQAAMDARVDLFPRRVAPSDLTREQRENVRDLLDSLAPQPEPPPPPERAAFDKWLSGANWPLHGDDELDLGRLRALSARAADSLESWRAAQAKLLSRRSSKPKRDDSGWSEF